VRAWLVPVVVGLLAVAGTVALCRREPVRAPVEDKLMEATPAPAAGAPGTLKARVVSWDVGFYPPTEAEWIERVVVEVRDANAAGVDVLVFPELFAAGLGVYAPDDRYFEFITRRMNAAVLPAVKAAAGPNMLVCLGSYAHREAGWPHALNRAPILIDGTWHFADKIHPTQRERVDDPPIKAGDVLPVFRFRGGRVAVVVCFSLEMPEVSVALKKEGVQLVLGPTATEDEDGAARVLRAASARAVELGAAVLVAPLVGKQDEWKNVGSAAMYLPAQKGINHHPQESVRRTSGISRDDFVIPWRALLDLRTLPAGKPETRPFLAEHPFHVERK
jgi:predicted amidohydrolase